jgi:hypothetical protein
MDDQLLADELHALFDEKSAQGAPVVDRPAGVRRRVARHKRVRALSALVVVLLAGAGAAGVVTTVQHHAKPAPPAVKPSPSTPPGTLPAYASGGHLASSVRVDLRKQQSGSLIFTLTSLDVKISSTCVANDDIWMAVKINGHDIEGGGCSSFGGGISSASAPPSDQAKFWSTYGVALGQTATLTFEAGKHVKGGGFTDVTPVATTGVMSIGVYEPVPFDQFPLPPKPADWNPTADQMGFSPPDGLHKLLTISGPEIANGASGAMVTLGNEIGFNALVAAPGVVHVYIAGTEVFQCASYDWGMACGGLSMKVGKNELTGLHRGDKVWVSVQTSNFTETGVVQVDVYSK